MPSLKTCLRGVLGVTAGCLVLHVLYVFQTPGPYSQLALPAARNMHPNDTNCFSKELQWRHPPGNITVLASAPGSGNTWTRWMLSQATGLLTSSEYFTVESLPGDGVADGRALVVKTHRPYHLLFEGGKGDVAYDVVARRPRHRVHKVTRAVLILRHPFDCILADFHRKGDARTHKAIADMEKFQQKWGTFWAKSVRAWRGMNLHWLAFPGQLHVLRYEAALQNPEGTLKALLAFLGMRVPQERITCAVGNSNGEHRPKSGNTWADTRAWALAHVGEGEVERVWADMQAAVGRRLKRDNMKNLNSGLRQLSKDI